MPAPCQVSWHKCRRMPFSSWRMECARNLSRLSRAKQVWIVCQLCKMDLQVCFHFHSVPPTIWTVTFIWSYHLMQNQLARVLLLSFCKSCKVATIYQCNTQCFTLYSKPKTFLKKHLKCRASRYLFLSCQLMLVLNVTTRQLCCGLLVSGVVSNGTGQVSNAGDARNGLDWTTGGRHATEVTPTPHVSHTYTTCKSHLHHM